MLNHSFGHKTTRGNGLVPRTLEVADVVFHGIGIGSGSGAAWHPIMRQDIAKLVTKSLRNTTADTKDIHQVS